MRLLSREELGMAQFVPKEDRYGATSYLAVWADRVEVTNGHYAIIYTDTGKPGAGDFPAIPNAPGETKDPTWPILIPRDAALKAFKVLPKRVSIPILGFAAMIVDELGTARIYTTDLESWNTIVVPRVGQKWPPISTVLPAVDKKQEPMDGVGLNSKYLGVIAEATQMISRRDIPVCPALYNETCSVWTANAEGGSRKLTVALMPMRA